jgi:PIN domain nuclease of toxin-antitoxin system
VGSKSVTSFLLDTHVLIWLLRDAEKISETVYAQIQDAADADSLVVSAITPWEIGVLVAKKRIDLGADVMAWIDAALNLPGIRLQPLLPEIAVASTRLPGEIHSDPADRILVATARHIGATLITADEQLLRYAAQGNLRCMAAS